MPTGGVTKTNIKACRSKHTGVGFVKATVVACDEDDNITAEVSGSSVLDAGDRHVEVSSPGNSNDVGPATCDWITKSRGTPWAFKMAAGNLIHGGSTDMIAVELEVLSFIPFSRPRSSGSEHR